MSEPDFSKKAADAQTSAARSRPDMTGISVILPNFNHSAFLPAALSALARQRPAPHEIIVIDDASTDDSIAVIAAHAKLIPQLKLLRHQTNRGAIAALNTGLEAASCPYVCFAAADDITFEGLFENLLPMLIANPQAAFCSAECVVTDQNGNHIGFRPVARPSQTASCFTPAETQALLRKIDNWILTGSAVFRRDLLVAAGGFDPALSSLADGFVARQLACKHGFCFVPRVLVNWRISSGGVSRTTTRTLDHAHATLARARAVITSGASLPIWYADLFSRRWRFAVGRLALGTDPIDENMLMGFVATNILDRSVLRIAGQLPQRFGKWLGLGWLTLRLRPTSLVALARTAWARRNIGLPKSPP